MSFILVHRTYHIYTYLDRFVHVLISYINPLVVVGNDNTFQLLLVSLFVKILGQRVQEEIILIKTPFHWKPIWDPILSETIPAASSETPIFTSETLNTMQYILDCLPDGICAIFLLNSQNKMNWQVLCPVDSLILKNS